MPVSAGWTGRALLSAPHVCAVMTCEQGLLVRDGQAVPCSPLLMYVLSVTCEQGLSVVGGQAVPCSPLLMYVVSVTCASKACQCWLDRPCPALRSSCMCCQ
ncbi:hypothetical protein NDU88_007211 [Pleurodeles waltl]|uniref:Uncharacterized protein n=1 Tax=Pleurodeles waltl TaxID=8319 RepID=A0AAV7MFD8_PLEWA|nr:hypothetical protein NDU88_007211 [Pleurodeles waltl]